jgi:hypothetical protein
VLGFFSFTEITDPGAHRAYNEWHQLDHLPEQFTIDGISFGQRWVRSPRCTAAQVATGPLLDPFHYMTLYLLRDAAVVREFMELGRRLHQVGRFFHERRAVVSGPFDIVGRWVSPRLPVSAGSIPWRPSQGVYAVVGPAADGAALAATEGVAGAWQFTDERAGRTVTVAFVEGDLIGVAGELGAQVAALGQAVEWAGPLERVDAYQWDWFATLTPR